MTDWFDERFTAAGAQNFHASLVRIGMAFLIWTVLGLGIGWRDAGLWLVVVLAVEWPLREMTRPLARGRTLSRFEAVLCMGVYAVAVAAWSSGGALLWASNHEACQIAGVAFFAGQLFYLATHHARSMGALTPALPAFAAPILAPLVLPHFHGVDQALVEAAMLAVVGHAGVSIALSFHEAESGRRASDRANDAAA
jgi:hypothetical protein